MNVKKHWKESIGSSYTEESLANEVAENFFKAIEEIERNKVTTRRKPKTTYSILSSGEYIIE